MSVASVVCCQGLCDELITRPEESYRLCCVVVCDLETSRIGAPYIYNVRLLRVKGKFVPGHAMGTYGSRGVAPPILKGGSYGGERSASLTSHFNAGERTCAIACFN